MAREDYKTRLRDGVRMELSEADKDRFFAKEQAWLKEQEDKKKVQYRVDRVKGTFKEDRTIDVSGYATIGDQMDMQYKDLQNGTTTWKDHIAKVKSDHPKPE